MADEGRTSLLSVDPTSVKIGSGSRRFQGLAGALTAFMATSNLYVPTLGLPTILQPATLVVLATFLLAFHNWVGRRFYVGVPHLWLILCLIALGPGMLLMGDNSYATSKVFGIIATLAMAWACMELLTVEASRRVFLYTIGILGLLVAVSLLAFGETSTFPGRNSVAGLNPIGLGRITALGALISVLIASGTRVSARFLLFFAAVVMAFASATTGSRGPLLAAVIGLVIGVLLFSENKNRILQLVGITGGAGLIALYLYAEDIDGSFSRLGSTAGSNRGDLWEISLSASMESPLGIGFGNLYRYLPHELMGDTGYAQYSHNFLIEALAEGGLILCGFLILFLIQSLRNMRNCKGGFVAVAMGSVWIASFINASLSSDFVGNRLMWVMLAVGVGYDLQGRFNDGKHPSGLGQP